MIDIYNYNLYQDYASFSFSIDENKKNLILFVDTNDIKDKFGKQIAGINFIKDIYINNQIIFDNKNYFDSRLYLDSKINYFKTLDEKAIANQLLNNYSKAIKEDELKQMVHDFGIREYFSKKKLIGLGKDLFVMSLALSSINNSIINIKDVNVLKNENVIKNITESNNGLIILSEFKPEVVKSNYISCYDNIYFLFKDHIKKMNSTEAISFNVEASRYE